MLNRTFMNFNRGRIQIRRLNADFEFMKISLRFYPTEKNVAESGEDSKNLKKR